MTLTVTPVRFEHHRHSALGIEIARPRLSWMTTGAPSGWEQAAYELQEAEGPTARVDSASSVLVDWPFPELRSRDTRTVRVRVHGKDDSVSEWSRWSVVEAGLLAADDWVGSMVGPKDAETASPLVGPPTRDG